MRFDLVVFDLDGTLVDSLLDIAGALNRALVRNNRKAIPVPQVRTFIGDGIAKLVDRAVASSEQMSAEQAVESHRVADLNVQKLRDEVWADYVANPCVKTAAFAGAEATLDRLAAAGAQLAVLTNKPGDIARALLGALGLAERFFSIVGDQDGLGRKPEAQGLRALMDRAGVTPGRTLMVGDGLPDIRVAHAAGCQSAAALWGYAPPESLIKEKPNHQLADISEVLPLVCGA